MAHPDDESGAFCDSILQYKARGVEIFVICLTPGQAATNSGTAQSDEELASLRRAKFAAACKILKVNEGQIPDDPDGALARMNFYDVVGDLARRV